MLDHSQSNHRRVPDRKIVEDCTALTWLVVAVILIASIVLWIAVGYGG